MRFVDCITYSFDSNWASKEKTYPFGRSRIYPSTPNGKPPFITLLAVTVFLTTVTMLFISEYSRYHQSTNEHIATDAVTL